MARRALALAWLLAGVSTAAAESSTPHVVQAAKEVMPAAKKPAEVQRKPAERKPGEVPKGVSRDTPKPPPTLLDEKNLGLGCAQG